MKLKGNLQKMQTELVNSKVAYKLPLNDTLLDLNPLIGKELHLQFTGTINCMNCKKSIRKTYAQGYCYDCFTTLPQTDVGMLHPEKDLSYIGISRDMAWSEKNSLVPHYVYLSFTDKVKVGVTRHTQIPTRWIDQGASQAIVLAKTPNRHIAGAIEVYLKNHFADKTSWQQMLTQNTLPLVNLVEEKRRAILFLHAELQQYVTEDNELVSLAFPLLQLPVAPKSIKLEAVPEIHKKLIGIKGQYLIFEDNTVVNIRNHGGYEVCVGQ